MQMNWLTKIARGQDGAIYNGYLFRFQLDGSCHVYDLNNIKPTAPCGYQPSLCCFDLDKTDRIVPHSNTVFFGTEFYEPEDEFPLLYSNIYNNYASMEQQRMGMCCVYRLQRQENQFRMTLVQLIEISFAGQPGLWCSKDGGDVRPYGNFLMDTECERLYAYTMIDDIHVTRYFAFPVPKARQGVMDPELGVPRFVLDKTQLLDRFDTPYQSYIQGGCCHNGIVYSLQGLADQPQTQGLVCISLSQKCQLKAIGFEELGLTAEPELIDFHADQCLYADNAGNTYYISL